MGAIRRYRLYIRSQGLHLIELGKPFIDNLHGKVKSKQSTKILKNDKRLQKAFCFL